MEEIKSVCLVSKLLSLYFTCIRDGSLYFTFIRLYALVLDVTNHLPGFILVILTGLKYQCQVNTRLL